VSKLIYKKILSTDNKAQMMVLESVVFSIIVIISLIFLYQISPTSTESTVYTSDLKIKGDSALQNLYNEEVQKEALPVTLPIGFPKNKLIYYLITDDYTNLISSNLKNLLPSSTTYNIFVSNGVKKTFWCNSALNHTPLDLTPPITVSHYFIPIHPQFFNGTKFGTNIAELSDGCKIAIGFNAYVNPATNDYSIKYSYNISTYDVILEMSKI